MKLMVAGMAGDFDLEAFYHGKMTDLSVEIISQWVGAQKAFERYREAFRDQGVSGAIVFFEDKKDREKDKKKPFNDEFLLNNLGVYDPLDRAALLNAVEETRRVKKLRHDLENARKQAAIDRWVERVGTLLDSLGRELVRTSRLGDPLIVRALLDTEGGGNLMNFKGEYDRTALMEGAAAGRTEVVELLLDRGAAVGAVSVGGCTALMLAASTGQLDVCRLLVSRGADMDHCNVYGCNALQFAAFHDHLPVCEFLLAEGANLAAQTNGGQETALSHYGRYAYNGYGLSPDTKAHRCRDLEDAWARRQQS